MPGDAQVVRKILDLARWAPSGDNVQPWRFTILSAEHVRIRFTPKPDNPYEYHDGQPTWLAVGCLLESIRIAASRWQFKATWTLDSPRDGEQHIHVQLEKDDSLQEDPRLPCLSTRSVERRRFQLAALTDTQKRQLEATVGEEFAVRWYTRRSQCWRWARLNAMATDIRLSIPETFPVHQAIVDWRDGNSPSGIPADAVGVDPGTQKLMRWSFKKWERMDRMNRYLAATLIPRIELDLVPGLCSAAFCHIAARAQLNKDGKETLWLRAGQAVQGLWLEATRLGLVLQPTLAPLAFATHAREKTPFTASPRALRQADRLRQKLAEHTTQDGLDQILFVARVGYRRSTGQPRPRSIRHPLSELLDSDT